MAVVVEHAIDDAPVGRHRRIGLGLRFLFGGACERPAGIGVAMAEPLPAGEITAVEQRLKAGGRGVVFHGTEAWKRGGIVGNPEVLKLDPVVVAGEDDVAASVVLAGMGKSVDHRHVIEEGIDDHGAVEDHHHMILDGDDRLGVPLANRLRSAGPRRGDAIDRAVYLPGLEPGETLLAGAGDLRVLPVERPVVVEDLDLETVARRIATLWHPDPDAVVAAGLEAKLERQREVAVLDLRLERLAPLLADEDAILDCIAGGVAAPASKIFPVEDRLPACLREDHLGMLGSCDERVGLAPLRCLGEGDAQGEASEDQCGGSSGQRGRPPARRLEKRGHEKPSWRNETFEAIVWLWPHGSQRASSIAYDLRLWGLRIWWERQGDRERGRR